VESIGCQINSEPVKKGVFTARMGTTPQIEGSLRVSLAEMTTSGKFVADYIASLAWKATGYRFR